MTFRDCAVQAWKELGWDDERIKRELAIRDKNAAVITDVTYKQLPPELEREIIDELKKMATAPESVKNRRRAISRKVVAEMEAKTNNN